MRTKKQTTQSRSKASQTIESEKQAPRDYMLTHLEKAAEIAHYYGFLPIRHPESAGEDTDEHLRLCPEEKVRMLKMYKDETINTHPYPFMVFSHKPFRADNPSKPREHQAFNLDLIGSHKSIAEALLIKTGMAILEEEGFRDLYVKINNVGDRDTLQRFERSLSAYYRKCLSDLHPQCKDAVRRDVFGVMRCQHDDCLAIHESAPQAISFLSEPHRTHFREVLEYLEALGIPYEIDNTLMDHRECSTHTMFEVWGRQERGGDDIPLARGSRYNRLTRKAGLRKEAAALGMTLHYRKALKSGECLRSMESFPARKFCITHLGREAQSKTLCVVENLRRTGIPVYHNLTKDKLVGQMACAEQLKVPYIIIMGQKEALEDCVIVRDMHTYVQETVRIDDLAKRLRKYR